VSEKIDGLEVFDAQRHAGRVLGMGDIVGLVEEVQKGVDMAAAQKLVDKVKAGDSFDLNDFLSQISQMKNMGGLSGLMDKLPSQLMGKAGNLGPAAMDRAERDMRRMEGIISSMTPLERRKPDLLKATRKRRVAQGAGVQVQEVNRLLNQFEQMRDMMKKMKGGGMMKMMKRMGGMKGMGGMGGPGKMR
jgi:signal recognition particle subunit SRP54